MTIELQRNSKEACPFLLIVTVDCDWTSWSDWSSCSKTCGAGVREKSRQVKTTAQNDGSPINLRFGSPCSGSARQTESCNIQECPGNTSNKKIDMFHTLLW